MHLLNAKDKRTMTKTTTPKRVQWIGEVTKCDICDVPIDKHFVDGRMKFGGWALMCIPCHSQSGVGFGEGCGQQYARFPDGKFYKTKG
jgi:hypothetical protein